MPERVVILELISERTADRMRQLMPPGLTLDHMRKSGEEHMAELIADADYAIVSQPPVPAHVIRRASRLKLLQKWGVGVDNIDLTAARERGIAVARTSGSNAVPVAEFTLGLILAACRCIASSHAELRTGVWKGGGQLPIQTMTLSRRTVGIVGLGAIGQALARLLRGFDCTILYSKRAPLSAAQERDLGVTYARLPELLGSADIVTLNCPLNEDTAGLINRSTLQLMKRTAILINSARGGVVIEDDLVWALRNAVIAAAALDVFEREPVPADHPLLSMSNVLVTPHIAASAADSFEPGVRHMFENIARVSRGEAVSCDDLVT